MRPAQCFRWLFWPTAGKTHNKIILGKITKREYTIRPFISLRLLLIFQLSDHEEIGNATKSTSIRFFAYLQTNLAKQVRECQATLRVFTWYQNNCILKTFIQSEIYVTKINTSPFFQKLPELHLDDMSLICRTFSLATLRNIFPDAASWKAPGSHHPPGGNHPPSPYVHIYIGMLIFDWDNSIPWIIICSILVQYTKSILFRSSVIPSVRGSCTNENWHTTECGKNCIKNILWRVARTYTKQKDQI